MIKNVTTEHLVTIAEAELLRNGGVDSWEFYDESMEEYVPSDDKYEDSVSFLNALSNGGVDNWDWAGESLKSLNSYGEYLNKLSDLNNAVDIHTWKKQYELYVAAQKESDAEVSSNLIVEVKGAASQKLYQHIADKYPHEDPGALYASVKEAGVWKSNTFAKEFKAALKVVEAGENNPMEKAREELLQRVIKNDKLDKLILTILDKKQYK